MDNKEICVKAEDIAHVLRDGLAFLPGSRARQGNPLIVFPSRETTVNPDHIRNVLLYFQSVCADGARERGFIIVIDMRGKQTWNNVKPVLKSINSLIETGTIVEVCLIIKPDKFWEKQKAQISLGFCKFEVQMVNLDVLAKYFDSSQLLRDLGGSFSYDHDSWLESRLELESWIWKISEVMRGLDLQRKQMTESESPVDVPTAEAAIKKHNNIKRAILAIPIDLIQQEAQRVSDRVNCCAVPNPDMLSALPHMANLVASLVELKTDVFKMWDARRLELENSYQLKLFENDAEKMLNWIRDKCDLLRRTMADVGNSEAETSSRLKDYAELAHAATSAEINRDQICSLSKRLKNNVTGPIRNRVEMNACRVEEEWSRVQDLLHKREAILTAANAFFRSAHTYFTQLPSWLEHPGVDPAKVNTQNSVELETAIDRHEGFWHQVEGVYIEAVNHGSHLIQAMKGAGVDDAAAREKVNGLSRAHKQLVEIWTQRKVLLHSLLALIAFQTDTQQVVEWLHEHGEPYLARNTAIGDNLEQAKNFQRNHSHFRNIANNTYTNADKLFKASRTIIQSGVSDAEKMRQLVGDLDLRIHRFKQRVDTRFQLLNQSMLFHTHYTELMTWYTDTERRYADLTIDTSVEVCEQNKERWLLESDGTAQAYATTISEGRQLVNALQQYGSINGIDYSNTINTINVLMGEIDQRNGRLTEQWTSRRLLLQIAFKFACLLFETKEILSQIRNWEEDMRAMIESATFMENAETVQGFHKENTMQVKDAVRIIRRSAHDLLQAVQGQPELEGLRTRDGDSVVEMVKLHLAKLDASENHVMKCAVDTTARIEGARKFLHVKQLAKDMTTTFEREERNLQMTGTIPSSLEEALKAQEIHAEFQKRVETNNCEAAKAFYKYSNDLIRSQTVERSAVVELNEQVMSRWRRLVGLSEERNKLLKAAVVCYRTFSTAVVPILAQLEKEYANNPDRDWCIPDTDVDGSPQELVGFVSKQLAKHMEFKDRFITGCSYAQTSSDLFLKYLTRTPVQPEYRQRHEQRVIHMRNNLRERQSHILELWTRKKKQLDRCHQYVLTDASKQQILDWINGEGEAKLSRFCRHPSANLRKEELAPIIEDFQTFKITVKEQRANIQTMLRIAQEMTEENQQHADDIKNCMAVVRRSFEEFSSRVIDCEESLKGGTKPIARDELSLDRHSDTSVEDKMSSSRREVDSKMREPMRELVKSERDYVDDLSRCCRVYVSEYDAAVAGGTLPASLRDKRKEIFGNIEDINSFHKDKFLGELTKYECDPEGVGACFTVWVGRLNELYTDYCVNKEQNNHLIATPEALSFFANVRERHQLEVNNDLGSLLIKPVQRITRYRLMMEQLMKTCTGSLEEIKEALEVVLSVPRRANDIIHYNCLEQKDKLSAVGPFVMQDSLTVWEPRAYFKGKGKDRQVFLFELAIVFAKRLEMGPKSIRYVIKGKPVLLNEVSVVEHVEGDACRFGLRIGAVSSNENRTDLKASSETIKVAWVRRIRELTQGLFRIGPYLSGDGLDAGSVLSVRSSVGSSSRNSENRLSRDAESIGSNERHRYSQQDTESISSSGQRFSIQSTSSVEQCTEHWTVSADYDGSGQEGHLVVRKGDRVEVVECVDTASDMVMVSLSDDPTKVGLVPFSLLLPDEPSSSAPDRPDASPATTSTSKRKSLRRILSSNNKDRSSPSGSAANTQKESGSSSPNIASHPVLTAPAEVIGCGLDLGESGLPPPMIDLHVPLVTDPSTTTTNNTSNLSNGENMTVSDDASTAAEVTPENNGEQQSAEPKSEMSPQETARLKRHYVLMELVETERDYVRDLASVVDGYVANCRENLPEDLVGKDKIIFANIAQIQEFHETSFLKEIEKCMENYEAAGHAFVKYERRLHTLYVKYCQNKPKSDYLVAQEQFDQFFAETKLKLGHRVALCDLLIKPVQRIMKYQLLLKDVLKFTERAGDRVEVLKRALDVMHVVPKACDDMMQVGRLQNFDGNLNAQGKLIFQGTLSISESVGGKAEKGKDRRIFLFEQSAIIADHIPPKREFGNPTYIFKSQIMVSKMVLDPNVPEDPLKFIIRSSDPSQQTSFIAQSNSLEEKEQYIAAISAQLDQQKTLLAALVDPKRYQSQLLEGVGSLNLEERKSSSTGAMSSSSGNPFGRLGGGSAQSGGKSTPASGKESPKHSGAQSTAKKSGGLFGFGKKSAAKSPTSPPPVDEISSVRATLSSEFKPMEKGDFSGKKGDQVQVLSVEKGRALVRGKNGSTGRIPTILLTLTEIPGNTLAEQIQYRRQWTKLIDEISIDDAECEENASPLTPPSVVLDNRSQPEILGTVPSLNDGRPVVLSQLGDITVRQNENVLLSCVIGSSIPFTVTCRGPAVDSGKAKIEIEDAQVSLVIDRCLKAHQGPYSVVASNQYGSTSTSALLNVEAPPDPPYNVKTVIKGANLRLSWNGDKKNKFMVEYKRDGLNEFRCARSDLSTCKVSLRHFRPLNYALRVVAYNDKFRSEPSQEIHLDFTEPLESSDSLPMFEDKFSFCELLGQGRSTLTFAVRKFDEKSRNFVAKVCTAKGPQKNILREARLLSALHHPNIVASLGAFNSERGTVLVTERALGTNVAAFLTQKGYVSELVLREITSQVLDALDYIHQRGIVHLDVKPQNIFIEKQVKLAYFGCAQEAGTNRLIDWGDGDKRFRALEADTGVPPTTKADIWSLGAVLCVLCWGKPPSRSSALLPLPNSNNYSKQLTDLISTMLSDCNCRPAASSCLQQDWFIKPVSDELLAVDHIERWIQQEDGLTVRPIKRSASYDCERETDVDR